MPELETVRTGGVILQSTKSSSIKESSAPLCQTCSDTTARATATDGLLTREPETWLSYSLSKTALPQCSDYNYLTCQKRIIFPSL